MAILDLIKENPSIIIAISAADLIEFGKNIASESAKIVLAKFEYKMYTPDEVMGKFNICRATLWRWDKEGFIKGKKIGQRKYYSEDEINNAMNNFKGNDKL